MNERDRQLLIKLCARLSRMRGNEADRYARNNIDRELNALRRVLAGG